MTQIKKYGITIKTLLGRNIKFYRDLQGYSQEELAEKAGISMAFLGTIERGEKWPSVDTLAGLAIGLQVKPYDLFKPEHIVSQDINKYTEKMLKEIQASVNEAVSGINQTIVKNSDKDK